MDVMKLVVGGSGRLDEPAARGREGKHQGRENKIIEPEFGSAEEGKVGCRERLGGLLRYYYRDYHYREAA